MANNIRKCSVCGTIELERNVLIPDGKYQLINQEIDGDAVLSIECLKTCKNQLSEREMEQIISENNLYDSCRHH